MSFYVPPQLAVRVLARQRGMRPLLSWEPPPRFAGGLLRNSRRRLRRGCLAMPGTGLKKSRCRYFVACNCNRAARPGAARSGNIHMGSPPPRALPSGATLEPPMQQAGLSYPWGIHPGPTYPPPCRLRRKRQPSERGRTGTELRVWLGVCCGFAPPPQGTKNLATAARTGCVILTKRLFY